MTDQNIFPLQFDLHFSARYHQMWSVLNAAAERVLFGLYVGGPGFERCLPDGVHSFAVASDAAAQIRT